MKKIVLMSGLLFITVALMISSMALAKDPKEFTLDDIPPLKNKTALKVPWFAGGGVRWAEKSIPDALKAFEEKTGVQVIREDMNSTVMYSKQNIELMSETGAYALYLMEAAQTNEWAPWLYPIVELGAKYEPEGKAGAVAMTQGFAPSMIRAVSDQNRVMYAFPVFAYDAMMYYREDVFSDPTEKDNFKKKYDYELAPPKTRDQLLNVAEFFFRKKGELLKGKPIDQDQIYGICMMAGRFEVNDEVSAMMWARGGDWGTVVRGNDGKVKEIVITIKNKEALKDALEYYKKLLKFASPGSFNAEFQFMTSSFLGGNAMTLPYAYSPWAGYLDGVKDKIPGAKMAIAAVPEGHGYTGCWSYAISKACKNPEGAYWLGKYLTSFKAHKFMVDDGQLPGVRADVLELPEYTKEESGVVGKMNVGIANNFRVHKDKMDAYLNFNSAAMGKIYEQQIIICHEAVTGAISVDEAVKRMTETTIKLQNKFGKGVKAREEK